MIFSAEQARLILAGRKTQARRLAFQRPKLPAPSLTKRCTTCRTGCSVCNGTTLLATSQTERLRTTGHRVGRVYPLERYARGDEVTPWQRVRMEQPAKAKRKRTSPPVIVVANMRCTELRLQRVGDIDVRDAKAEGFRTTDEFKDAWVESRDRRWMREPEQHLEVDTQAALARFDSHHADRLVWVFSFEIIETPRLLKASASFDDYTDKPSRAANHEPEALTEDQLIALTRFRPAVDDARRRQPLTAHAHNMARELDEIRNRVPDENLSRDAKRTLRQVEIYADRLRDALGS